MTNFFLTMLLSSFNLLYLLEIWNILNIITCAIHDSFSKKNADWMIMSLCVYFLFCYFNNISIIQATFFIILKSW